jgi:acyl carrier protein
MTSTGPDEKKSVLGSILKFLPSKRAEDTGDGRPKDREAIQAWLIKRVSAALSLNPDEIDVRETFASFGLDSRTAVSLSGDLERWLGRRLPPTLVWDYPTIEALADHLADDAVSASSSGADSHSPIGSK